MKKRTHALGVALLILAISSVPAFSQSRPLSQGPYRIEIVLERNEKGSWHAIDSRLVLDQNDLVRFRVRANFSGYLYVTNQSTSGKYEVLFPAANSGRENKIEAEHEYLIPATQGSFRVTGPAGQEVVYWVVSPVELNSAKPVPPPRNDAPKPSPPPTLIPRCDDTLLRARGNCMDTSAGAKQLQKSDPLPDDLKKFPDLASRDLLFIRQEGSSVISSSTPLNGPVIYEFRLAHR